LIAGYGAQDSSGGNGYNCVLFAFAGRRIAVFAASATDRPAGAAGTSRAWERSAGTGKLNLRAEGRGRDADEKHSGDKHAFCDASHAPPVYSGLPGAAGTAVAYHRDSMAQTKAQKIAQTRAQKKNG